LKRRGAIELHDLIPERVGVGIDGLRRDLEQLLHGGTHVQKAPHAVDDLDAVHDARHRLGEKAEHLRVPAVEGRCLVEELVFEQQKLHASSQPRRAHTQRPRGPAVAGIERERQLASASRKHVRQLHFERRTHGLDGSTHRTSALEGVEIASSIVNVPRRPTELLVQLAPRTVVGEQSPVRPDHAKRRLHGLDHRGP
jgi:hypothetical protein